ncbi:MAG: DUF169 domain-containing protein [Candidatus Bathyarchaeia archaeon]
MEEAQEYCKKIIDHLKLRSFPLALKLVKDGRIPEESVRPLKDLGHHLSLCQAFTISRRSGKVLALMKEDNWCFEPVIGLGMAEPPELFLEGYNRYPDDVMTKEAGEHWARFEFPRLRAGSCSGVVVSPLKTASFVPDVVIMYVDPAQLTILSLAAACKNGKDIVCKLSGHAACVYAIAPVVEEGEPKVVLPCQGDRRRALAQDYEMIFSLPYRNLPDLVEGIEYLAGREGRAIPFPITLKPEYELREAYKVLGRIVGLNIP